MNIDKEISEMAGRIAKQTEEILEAKDNQIAACQHEIIFLDKENEVLRKALELSCKFRLDFGTLVGNEYDKELKENMDYFIQQAKESLK